LCINIKYCYSSTFLRSVYLQKEVKTYQKKYVVSILEKCVPFL
jgi:hypothetical protein